MSAVAQLLLKQGWTVSGCDLKESALVSNLRQSGIPVWIGHSAQHLEAVDTVAYSSAIPIDNPEIQEAKRRGLRLMKRAEILSLLMQDKTVITVTGMHGKTTTASLASYLLSEAGLFPTVAVGGILQNLGANVLMGEGRFFVAEADESDGTFLCYHPDYSIITNIDHEHLDYYRDFGSIQEAFQRFINQTKQQGTLFCWRDDPYLGNLLRDYKNRVIFFGLQPSADLYASDISVLDDYGHHPAEIKATLEAVRLLNPQRLLVIFQPHRYTRTKFLLDSFATCFDLADYVIITDIYSAGEPAIEGVSGYSIYEKLNSRVKYPKQIEFLPREKILEHVINILNPQDVVLVLGAVDITKISDELAEVLKRQAQEKGVLSKIHQF